VIQIGLETRFQGISPLETGYEKFPILVPKILTVPTLFLGDS
jgi:hypothetical protein